ncbi:RluA family pseudouridine synthase [Endozoicomonas sp.]|uniref:RluA family pseudouridine synthase n=1 Tax=Endozoicomonas sp. TaxID=1892382 RepID=UPI002883AFFF|nr:RluA family pseudouridine synthase [Endozoicomonas sp.]
MDTSSVPLTFFLRQDISYNQSRNSPIYAGRRLATTNPEKMNIFTNMAEWDPDSAAANPDQLHPLHTPNKSLTYSQSKKNPVYNGRSIEKINQQKDIFTNMKSWNAETPVNDSKLLLPEPPEMTPDKIISSILGEIEDLKAKYNKNNQWQNNLLCIHPCTELSNFYGDRANVPLSLEKIICDAKKLETRLIRTILSQHCIRPPVIGLPRIIDDRSDLNILYQDADIIIINKPSKQLTIPTGVKKMSIHRKKTTDNTLLHGLIRDLNVSENSAACFLTSRLDYGTSGLCLIAKHLAALSFIKSDNNIKKYYLCVTEGHIEQETGFINNPIPSRYDESKLQNAETHYQVIERYTHHTLASCRLITGRRNQIRIHMKSIGHPLVGDRQFNPYYALPYFFESRRNEITNTSLFNTLLTFDHVALHAFELTFIHPRTEKKFRIQAPIPEDFLKLQTVLKQCTLNDQMIPHVMILSGTIAPRLYVEGMPPQRRNARTDSNASNFSDYWKK